MPGPISICYPATILLAFAADFAHNVRMWLSALLLTSEPVPPSELAGLFTADDYPVEALERNEGGTVKFEADILADGRVSACRVTQSSGSPILDATMCRIIMRRGRFVERAKQHQGKPHQISTQVTWHSQAVGIPVRVEALRIIFSLQNGRLGACRTESPNGTGFLGGCEAARKFAEPVVDRLAEKRSLDGLEYVMEMGAIPGDHLRDSRPDEPSVEVITRETALLSLAADGRVITCKEGEPGFRTPVDMKEWCASFVKNERYEPLPVSVDNQSERQITKVNAVYLRRAVQP